MKIGSGCKSYSTISIYAPFGYLYLHKISVFGLLQLNKNFGAAQFAVLSFIGH